MEDIAKELIGTGATGLIVILGLYFVTSLNKRQIAKDDASIQATIHTILPKIDSIAAHLASIDEGMREFYKTGLDTKYRLEAINQQLDRIDHRNV